MKDAASTSNQPRSSFGGTGWNPFNAVESKGFRGSESANPDVSTDTPDLQLKGTRKTRFPTGEARGVSFRTEQHTSRAVNILTFRLERYDKQGNRQVPIPVEIRGDTISGVINEGDLVEVRGRYRAGRTIKASKLRNLTHGGALVRGKSYSIWRWVWAIVSLGMLAGFVYLMITVLKPW